MQSNEIRSRFLKFFEKREHKIIPSSSLVPENDPSVLFNTAGMQPLVPYLLGQEHPMGKRIVNIQKCVRTSDLDDIGDNRHFSFFEMMGNWSLGDYFKEDAIKWSYEFLTSKEEGLGLDPRRLYITVFEGDENATKDTESAEIWKSLRIPEHRIYFLGAEDNWWAAGDNGPCGPDTEMFYDMIGDIGDLSHQEFLDAIKKEEVIEIWNDVFMEYEKKDGKVIGKLKQKNVDTGAGLERITAVMQGKKTAYDTDLFVPILSKIDENTNSNDFKGKRIVADHIRTAVLMIADGVVPSNTERGYVLRRLLRRARYYYSSLGANDKALSELVYSVIPIYKNVYELSKKISEIDKIITLEETKFLATLELGRKKYEEGKDAFTLYTTFGYPIDLAREIAKENGQMKDFDEKIIEHSNLSRTSSAGMFKGGLANHNEKTIKLHTAHHLLLAGLQAIVNKNIKQRGSNITEERLRLDFLCDHKLTDDEKQKVEDWVNDKINLGLNVIKREMPLSEAEKIGAEMEFGAKYPETVSVYFIEEPAKDARLPDGQGSSKNSKVISKEFCGGPHVSNTSELGSFKIQKEEAVAQGIRRIKAVLS